MIISLSGKVWAGKWTAANILCEKLWYEYISIGNIKRAKAEQMGIDIHEFNRLGALPENIAEYENAYETYQQDLDVSSNIVLDSRLSWYNQPQSFKVFLQVSDENAAHRLLNDTKRFGEAVGNYDLILDLLVKRNQWDRDKYAEIYQTDLWDVSNFDLVINTDKLSAIEVSEIILAAFERWHKN